MTEICDHTECNKKATDGGFAWINEKTIYYKFCENHYLIFLNHMKELAKKEKFRFTKIEGSRVAL